MAYVVTEACIGIKDRACVEVCPVDCFYNNPDPKLNEKVSREPRLPNDYGMLVINPDECIHCGACEYECPAEAIYDEDEVPEDLESYIELNAKVAAGYSDKELEKYRVTAKL